MASLRDDDDDDVDSSDEQFRRCQLTKSKGIVERARSKPSCCSCGKTGKCLRCSRVLARRPCAKCVPSHSNQCCNDSVRVSWQEGPV